MLVVLDTNVLVSALWSRNGNPAEVLAMVLSGLHVPCYDYRIIEEYVQVMTRPKFRFSYNEVDTIVRYIQDMGVSVAAERINDRFMDEDDKKFYEVAKTAGAVLITGNLRHFPASPLVMTAKEFLDNQSRNHV